MSTTLMISIAYLLFLSNFSLSYSNHKSKFQFEYNGIVWVALDQFTILYYQSDDEPMNWVEINRQELEQTEQ